MPHVRAQDRTQDLDRRAGDIVYQPSSLGRTEFGLAELFDVPVTQARKMIRRGSKQRRDEPPPECWIYPEVLAPEAGSRNVHGND